MSADVKNRWLRSIAGYLFLSTIIMACIGAGMVH